MSPDTKVGPALFIIFGGTGDLSRRKLLPALGQLTEKGLLGDDFYVLGLARSTQHDDASFRDLASQALAAAEVSPETANRLAGRCYYQSIGEQKSADFGQLAARIDAIETTHGLPGNRAFYLSLPPGAFRTTVTELGKVGLSGERSGAWTRVVVEKPFGRDLESARELNALIHGHFSESQVYRIDHYLGKETVQNLLVFRFANSLFESMWNRDRVAAVQITVAETLGVGTRANYYDRSGALRDMVQNHLSQLLTLVAMEVPEAFRADAIRYEKVKVLRSIAPIQATDVVLGQYADGVVQGQPVVGYLQEPGVPSGSQTETFAALKLEVDSWRWQGVPFYLRTGKRMGGKTTTIAVRFRAAPVCLFESMGGCPQDMSNVLLITLQPDEGFSLHFDVKRPGQPFALRRIPLRFRYNEAFAEMPEAYQTLLLDVLQGDQTLFVHGDEVEASWSVFGPLLSGPRRVLSYRAGGWGPAQADRLAIAERDLWQVTQD